MKRATGGTQLVNAPVYPLAATGVAQLGQLGLSLQQTEARVRANKTLAFSKASVANSAFYRL